MTMRPNPLATLILLATCTQVAANDLYQAINRLRAGDTTCARAANLQPLAANPQLERVAASLAKGGVLAESVKESGYRATRSAAIRLSGGGTSEQRLAVLQSHYCAQLLDSASADIGIYEDERQLAVVLAAPFAPRVSESTEAAAKEILALVNKARSVPRKCGKKSLRAVGPLRWNSMLAKASRLHAEDMARHSYMSHDGRDGSDPAQRVARAGYNARAMGENVAAGQMSSEDVVASWIRSPPHCANLMHPAYTEMGVAFAVDATSENGVYWAQEFGSPR
jgi:uncharacterized protein YkwD